VIRKGRKYSPEEILPHVELRLFAVNNIDVALKTNLPRYRNLDGDKINFASLRLQTFAWKGITCARCGIDGEFFIKEKHHQSDKYFHLSFYAIDGYGKEILMTKDHVIPKSKGGKDHIDNMQTLCTICNAEKGSDPWNIK
jgi:5-methylcytosine-specific restriction endonuclease McrA